MEDNKFENINELVVAIVDEVEIRYEKENSHCLKKQ